MATGKDQKSDEMEGTEEESLELNESPEKGSKEDEYANLLKTLKELKEMPKVSNPDDLKIWMQEYLMKSGELLTGGKKADAHPGEKIKHFTLSPSAIKKEPQTSIPPLLPPPLVKPKKFKMKGDSDTSSPFPVSTTETVTTSILKEPPKISIFSGGMNKNETSYDLWRYEVSCLLREEIYPRPLILQSIRRSLKGEAGRVQMRIGPEASIEEILQKMDSMFGDIEKKEDILAHFYGARQKEDETVTAWSCRLEDILGKAVIQGIVRRNAMDSMLRSMLWTGLKPSLKDISGHKYDAIEDFDGLRVALRQIEMDQVSRVSAIGNKQIAKSSISNESDMEEIKGMIQQLSVRMDKYEL